MGNKISSRRLSMKTMKELQNNIYVDFSKDEIKEWYHEFSKHLPKGQTTLSRMEFIKVYNSLFDGDASAFATQVFRTFDTDRDNAVDFKEFILGLCISGSDEPSLKLRWAFKMYDIYGDGFISEDEMVQMINAVCRMTNCHFPEEFSSPQNLTRNIFKVLDKDFDNRISLEEFLNGAENINILVDILQCHPSPE